MNLLIISCHPYDRSLTRAIAGRAASAASAAGLEVTHHDLYDESFDPVLSGAELARRYSLDSSVQRYIEEVRAADHLFFVHPDWWSGPPAVMKGWIERVLRPGVAYDWVGEEFAEKEHTPLLGGRSLTAVVTTDRDEEDEPEAIREFWNDLCDYSGLSLASLLLFPAVRESSFRQRREWLRQVGEYAGNLSKRNEE